MAPMDSIPQTDREINAYGWQLAGAAMDCVDLAQSTALMREANDLRHAYVLANPSKSLIVRDMEDLDELIGSSPKPRNRRGMLQRLLSRK